MTISNLGKEIIMDEKRRADLKNALQELNRYRLSNSQLFDRSILWLSSAGLGFSFAFLRDMTSLDDETAVGCLYLSWWAFGLAIAATLISIPFSQCGLEKQSKWVRSKLEGSSTQNSTVSEFPFVMNKLLGYISAGLYIIGIILTIIFIQYNA